MSCVESEILAYQKYRESTRKATRKYYNKHFKIDTTLPLEEQERRRLNRAREAQKRKERRDRRKALANA